MMASLYDLAIIGGGIVGLATALKVTDGFPRTRLLIVEKERGIGQHQTGHNSGVIHSGLYYRPGSVKARTCVSGRKALLEFCERHGIRYEICGKTVVATSEAEVPRLAELHRRGMANGLVGLEMMSAERLKEMEPHASAVRALFVPETGIIDYKEVAESYAKNIRAAGGQIETASKVTGIVERGGEIALLTTSGDYRARYLINCGGLYSDQIARMMTSTRSDGSNIEHQIIPFRGEYYKITPQGQHLVRNLIYPVPDPSFPFLGVHFTRMISGGVEAGPNAVLALAREGYRKRDVNLHDLLRTISFKGFWVMSARYWQTGFGELYRSFSKAAFVRALQKLVPEITEKDLVPGGAGVRAQAVAANGALVDDFVIQEAHHAIHVLNAPSPGATASLAIGQTIAAMAAKSFGLRREASTSNES